MYIVNRGKLHVMADNNKTVLATLKAGRSIRWRVARHGRRFFQDLTSARSVFWIWAVEIDERLRFDPWDIPIYFAFRKKVGERNLLGFHGWFGLDLWEVLKEYPAVRVKLESIAVKRLEKHKKPLIQQSECLGGSSTLTEAWCCFLVNLKRSKSAPGLVESSYRLPFHAPVRRSGSGVHRLSSVQEADINAISTPLLSDQRDHPATAAIPHASMSSHSLLSAAPLASSISFTSSLNSTRPPAINHSISWSTTTNTTVANTRHVGRTISLMNNDLRGRSTARGSDEVEQLKQRLFELEKEDLTRSSVSQQEYLAIRNRLKTMDNDEQW